MASEIMEGADVCPTEDAVAALLEFLVDPRLPAKPSTCHTPSQSDEESVAKQVYAVVLLYNFFYRKQHLQLELLDFESFCKLAVVLRTPLLAYMKFMKLSNDAELVDAEKQLSLTEKKIMDACDISINLINASGTLGRPISKVAVLLVDSKKENFFLQFSSITDGVWSLIEKDLDSKKSLVDTVGLNNTNKRRRIVRRSIKTEPAVDESNLQQLAFLAVMEATGIGQNDLTILESSIVYSLSKEKAATSFYMMQCTQPNNNDIIFPIKDVIRSLQGPLFMKNSGGWMHTSVVEYFHLLPYAEILSNWLSKEGISIPVQVLRWEMVDEKNIKITNKQYEVGFFKRCDKSHEKGSLIDCQDDKGSSRLSKQNDDNENFGNNPDTGLQKVNDDNECPVFGVPSNIVMSNVKESSGSIAAFSKNDDSEVNDNLVEPSDLSKLNSTTDDDSKKLNDDNECPVSGVPSNIGMSNVKESSGAIAAFTKNDDSGVNDNLVEPSDLSKLNSTTDDDKKVNDDNECPVFGVRSNIGMSNVKESSGSIAAFTKNDDSGVNDNLVEPSDLPKLNSTTDDDTKKVNDDIECPVSGVPSNIGMSNVKESSGAIAAFTKNDDNCVNDSLVEPSDLSKLNSTTDDDKKKVNDDNECPVFGVPSNIGMSNVKESSGSIAAFTINEDSGVNDNLVEPSDLSKSNSTTDDDKKAELIDTVTEPVLLPENNGEDATDGNVTHNVMPLDQEKKFVSQNVAVDHESEVDDLDEVHTTKCSKDKGLSETLVRVFTRKRKRLVELIDTIREPVHSESMVGRVADGNGMDDIISSDPDTKLAGDHTAVDHECNLGKVQTSKCFENRDLSETVLRVFFRKRDRLSLQQRNIEDQIAQCDKIIQTILEGGEDELMNDIESIIEGCNNGCPTGVSEERLHQRCAGSPQCIKMTRFLDHNLNMRNPCQELDDLCYENNWILPTYHVSAMKSGFGAKVHVKGMHFECLTEGEECSHPEEARASAAKKILAKLQKQDE